MHRRTVGRYVVFFLVVAAVAAAVATVAAGPSVSPGGRTYSQGDTGSADGVTWTVSVYDGTGSVASVNESARFTTVLANNSSVVFEHGTYRPTRTDAGSTDAPSTVDDRNASTANGTVEPRFVVDTADASNGTTRNGTVTNASSMRLAETVDVGARLREDPAVENTTLSDANGTRYVRYRNGTTLPLDAYLPPPETRTISVGDRFPYRNNSTTVETIDAAGATLAWRGTATHTQVLAEGATVRLAGTTYVVHFPTDDAVTLSRNATAYRTEMARLAGFHDHVLGLWGVTVISLLAAAVLVGLATLSA